VIVRPDHESVGAASGAASSPALPVDRLQILDDAAMQFDPFPSARDFEPAGEQRPPLGLGMLATAALAALGVGLVPLILFGAIIVMEEGTRIRAEACEAMTGDAQIAAQTDEQVDDGSRDSMTDSDASGIRRTASAPVLVVAVPAAGSSRGRRVPVHRAGDRGDLAHRVGDVR
jgi:hypothetical protein